jgi:hypothetical protein
MASSLDSDILGPDGIADEKDWVLAIKICNHYIHHNRQQVRQGESDSLAESLFEVLIIGFNGLRNRKVL